MPAEPMRVCVVSDPGAMKPAFVFQDVSTRSHGDRLAMHGCSSQE